MTDIYKQHEAAFSNVSAYNIIKINDKGEIDHTLKIAFKFPKDGAGRLYCYVHLIGCEMARDFAGGYGYDKRSAAVQHAVAKIPPYSLAYPSNPQSEYEKANIKSMNDLRATIQNAFENIGGADWQDIFRKLGYTVLQAV